MLVKRYSKGAALCVVLIGLKPEQLVRGKFHDQNRQRSLLWKTSTNSDFSNSKTEKRYENSSSC